MIRYFFFSIRARANLFQQFLCRKRPTPVEPVADDQTQARKNMKVADDARSHALQRDLADGVDEAGGFTQRKLKVSTGHEIALYEWYPSGGIEQARGTVFLLHGVTAHTSFEWLASDDENRHKLLKGSVVERLLSLDLFVVGYDHPGHGRSSGLHAYVESHDELRDACIDVITSYRAQEKVRGKNFIVAMSMGGSTAIRVCDKRPDLVDGYVLLSPAVRAPDDMFGWYGRFLKFISPVLHAVVPKLAVLPLPPPVDEKLHDATQKDPLLYRGKIRVQMALGFLQIYEEIDKRADLLNFKSVIIIVGGKDIIVSPVGTRNFLERIQSDDKDMLMLENMGHDVNKEEGCEEVLDAISKWIAARV